jgi:hypothetical protein
MATNQLTRRTLPRATAATAALAAPAALACSLMPAAVAAPVVATPHDPVIGFYRAMRKAEKRWDSVTDRQDAAADAAWDAGWNVRRPFMTVGNYTCSSVEMVVAACQPNDKDGPPAEKMPALVQEFRRRLTQQRRHRKAAGLGPLDAKVAAAKKEFFRLSRAFATAPALTMAGLVIKLRLVKSDIDDGPSLWAKPLIAGALADAKRLMGGLS